MNVSHNKIDKTIFFRIKPSNQSNNISALVNTMEGTKTLYVDDNYCALPAQWCVLRRVLRVAEGQVLQVWPRGRCFVWTRGRCLVWNRGKCLVWLRGRCLVWPRDRCLVWPRDRCLVLGLEQGQVLGMAQGQVLGLAEG